MSFHLSQRGRRSADVFIEPDVREVAWTYFPNYEELIHLGEIAAQSKLEEIRKITCAVFRKKVLQWPKKILTGWKGEGV